MQLENKDIGGEIISILTKGMYIDPKDALREYVQNGVDAGADSISIKVRHSSIVIRDNGCGMDAIQLRSAMRLGVSDKNPGRSVGFMGIGIYSAFHLCNELVIYSKTENDTPNRLLFQFGEMRDLLDQEREARFNEDNQEKPQTPLLNLMEKYVQFGPIEENQFGTKGTRVEMNGVIPSFYHALSNYNDVSKYIEEVIPLPFHEDFKYGQEIQSKLSEICSQHNAEFKLINVNLQINENEGFLYRPYHDDYFSSGLLPPKYEILSFKGEFFGIVWGCLNRSRQVLKKSDVRGFIVKKKGFTIGTRHDTQRYFGLKKYFDRYVGEIIAIHPELLPNAPRSNFEYSDTRVRFEDTVGRVVKKYKTYAANYQENHIAEENLNEAIDYLKDTKAELEFYLNDSSKLLEYIMRLEEYSLQLQKRLDTNKFRAERIDDAEKIVKLLGEQALEIRNLLEVKKNKTNSSNKKGGNDSTGNTKSSEQRHEEIDEVPETTDTPKDPGPTNLQEAIELSGIVLNEEISKVISLIDDSFIRQLAQNDEEYLALLDSFMDDLNDLQED